MRLDPLLAVYSLPIVLLWLAFTVRARLHSQRALAILEEGLIRHADYPSGHIVRARALRDMGKMEETLESFRRVLELDGANLVAIRELAGLADERGDTGEARHWYERLGQIDPANLEVRQRLRDLDAAAAETVGIESVGAGPVDREPEGTESGESPDVAEGPSAWWDDSAVNAPAHDFEAASDATDESRRPEDDAVEAILNGDVPQTVRAEDTWWYEEAPQAEEPEPSADADLLTRTMADLYAEQGLHREAAEIYELRLLVEPTAVARSVRVGGADYSQETNWTLQQAPTTSGNENQSGISSPSARRRRSSVPEMFSIVSESWASSTGMYWARFSA